MADLNYAQGALPVAVLNETSGNSLAIDASGNIAVNGSVAAGATDAGAPVKVGGVFTTALPTLTTGQRGNLVLDANSRIIIAPLTNSSVVKAQLEDNNGLAIVLGQALSAASLPVVIASDQTLSISSSNEQFSSYQPDPSSSDTGSKVAPMADASGRLETHSAVTTDEGGFRDDFSGTTITTAITGNLTYVNGSATVTGTNLQSQLKAGQYVKKTADAETLYQEISSVDSNTSMTLSSPYTGTSGAAASVFSNWITATPTGGSITVATSSVTLASGTVSGNVVAITKLGDYPPMTVQFYGSISQRIANQTAILGFVSPITGATAYVQFTGTTNTTVNLVSGFSSAAADTQTTAITLPNSGVTSTVHLYKLDVSANQVTLSIDGIVMAANTIHVGNPYDNLNLMAKITNTALAGSSTSFVIDYVYFADWDRVQIDNDFDGEPQRIQLTDKFSGNIANVTASGSIQVSEVLSSKTVYSATFSGIVIGATPTDMITLTGSATKTIRITRMEVSPSSTGNSTGTYFILTRSTANTAGTSTTLTNTAHDPTNAAASAVAHAYTANPTALGTVVGNIRATRIFTGALGSAGFLPYLFDFTNGGVDQGIVLRGAASSMAFNFNGAANPGGLNLTGWIEWVEE